MPDPGAPSAKAPSAPPSSTNPLGASAKMFTEIRTSAHLMTLDAGLFCIVQTPGARRPDDASGLPGVRLSLPPGAASRPQAISITSFRADGWLSGAADAALVRVSEGPAQILVTIYQAQGGPETAPRLQVLRLAEEAASQSLARPTPLADPRRPAAQPAANAAPPVVVAPVMAPGGLPPGVAAAAGAAPMATRAAPVGAIPLAGNFEIGAHVQLRGDIGAMFGEWVGDRGSKRWVEGFALTPRGGIAPQDIEYQAVLGRGWLSPWVEGGQLCGSRGMALPLLGLRVRLRGKARETHRCLYSASFVDGTVIGPVGDGEACEADSLAPLEAFQITLQRREPEKPVGKSTAETPKSAAKASAKEPARPSVAAKPAAKPSAKPPARAGKAPPPRRGR